MYKDRSRVCVDSHKLQTSIKLLYNQHVSAGCLVTVTCLISLGFDSRIISHRENRNGG